MSKFLFTWPAQIACAFCLDLLLGDPENFFHPVRWMGKAVQFGEIHLRKFLRNLRWAGVVLSVGLLCITAVSTWALLTLADAFSLWLGLALRIYIFYACLAVKSLSAEVNGVLDSLGTGNLESARKRLSRIVGRDTACLDGKEVLRAALETTAESTVDGIVSVLFYSFLGGPVLAMTFKMASTLDSMLGYKNERYGEFGWASARLDDAMNFLPARIGAVLIGIASLVLGKSPRRAWDSALSDAKNQPSPNSGYPEAAFAGALGVQLGGLNFYQGESVRKAVMGRGTEEITPEKVKQSLRLMIATSLLALLAGVLLWIFVNMGLPRLLLLV